MRVFFYDRSFEGILSAVFDAYTKKEFPDLLLADGTVPPLQTTGTHFVLTGPDKAGRVFRGLEKKLSGYGRNRLMKVWLSEEPGSDTLLFRFMRKVFDSKSSLEDDITDPDVLEMHQLSRKVGIEVEKLLGFARFQKTAQGHWFAALAPRYNTIPLLLRHFAERFSDQPWILYDQARHYGMLCEHGKFSEITLDERQIRNGELEDSLLAADEKTFQNAWREYCERLTIRERINPELQSRCMPRRFWPYLTEMK